jgi:ribonuclease III
MTEEQLLPASDDPQQRCEAALQYQFRDRELLDRCLTHASVARTRLESNERLEFLGDAILGAVVCDVLFAQFPDEPEGELTRIKSVVVSRTTCAQISQQLGLDQCVRVGKGLAGPQGVPGSIAAAVFESLIAGIYLDGGWAPARQIVQRLIQPVIDATAEVGHGRNYKSLLQHWAQRTLGETPTYHLLDEKGPDHSKVFQVSATVGTETFAPAWGPNKKEAEQRAAENALTELERQASRAPQAEPAQDV